MELTEETSQHHHGGIYNYFQGATIHNMVINGNMAKNGTEQFKDASSEKKSISSEQMISALKQCGAYIWGNAAYSIAFCVCRDVYHMGDNASQYERMLAERGVMIPAGTINTTISRNQWLKLHVDSWEVNGASRRALKLRDAFMEQVETLLIASRKNGIREKQC